MDSTFILLTLAMSSLSMSGAAKTNRPNVILVVTDDQGIGNLGCMGNPYIKTPNIDKFSEDCVRLTNFHVNPLSTPTRGAIITGRYAIHNGAWSTIKGRDIVSPRTPTIAEVFTKNGYQSALFGKWHLGDNYPCRPCDCGFGHVVQHLSGGVGELSDYWGNNYFDDTYLVNNVPTQFKGYCTDVWFSEAIKYMDQHKDDEAPMFIYLATNAPHGPHRVAEKYSKPYEYLKSKHQDMPGFYGQITNIDENFGKLLDFMEKENLVDNTILIFMTDNGAARGKDMCNNGYRGWKTSNLDGGHRVFFFIRWPAGKITGNKEINTLACHVDLLPTLAGMCNLKLAKHMELDGMDISSIFKGDDKQVKDRVMYVHNRQDCLPPFDVEASCVMKNEWRLLDGKKLYDVASDRKQQKDVAATHQALKDSLLDANRAFIAESKTKPEYKDFIAITVGNKQQKVSVLTIQHAIGVADGMWKSVQVAEGVKNPNDMHVVNFESDGVYKISFARWPRECQGTIWGIPQENPKDLFNYRSIRPEAASLSLNGKETIAKITEDMKEIDFKLKVKKGRTTLKANFLEGQEKYGVYYIYIEKCNY